ncbi:MAG: YtxH domain-containing protein [Patescibacteria group bacterium]
MASKKISILSGAAIGIALGVVAGLFLQSKKGKEIKKDAKQKVAEFYKYISPKLKKMKQLGEKEYFEFIETAAKNFSKAKKLTAEELKILIVDAKSTWKHLKKHAS